MATIEVEHQVSQSEWHTRYGQQKYAETALRLSALAAQRLNQEGIDCNIIVNPGPGRSWRLHPSAPDSNYYCRVGFPELRLTYPRPGSFEVSVVVRSPLRENRRRIQIWSKLDSKKWPNVEVLVEKLICFAKNGWSGWPKYHREELSPNVPTECRLRALGRRRPRSAIETLGNASPDAIIARAQLRTAVSAARLALETRVGENNSIRALRPAVRHAEKSATVFGEEVKAACGVLGVLEQVAAARSQLKAVVKEGLHALTVHSGQERALASIVTEVQFVEQWAAYLTEELGAAEKVFAALTEVLQNAVDPVTSTEYPEKLERLSSAANYPSGVAVVSVFPPTQKLDPEPPSAFVDQLFDAPVPPREQRQLETSKICSENGSTSFAGSQMYTGCLSPQGYVHLVAGDTGGDSPSCGRQGNEGADTPKTSLGTPESGGGKRRVIRLQGHEQAIPWTTVDGTPTGFVGSCRNNFDSSATYDGLAHSSPSACAVVPMPKSGLVLNFPATALGIGRQTVDTGDANRKPDGATTAAAVLVLSSVSGVIDLLGHVADASVARSATACAANNSVPTPVVDPDRVDGGTEGLPPIDKTVGLSSDGLVCSQLLGKPPGTDILVTFEQPCVSGSGDKDPEIDFPPDFEELPCDAGTDHEMTTETAARFRGHIDALTRPSLASDTWNDDFENSVSD